MSVQDYLLFLANIPNYPPPNHKRSQTAQSCPKLAQEGPKRTCIGKGAIKFSGPRVTACVCVASCFPDTTEPRRLPSPSYPYTNRLLNGLGSVPSCCTGDQTHGKHNTFPSLLTVRGDIDRHGNHSGVRGLFVTTLSKCISRNCMTFVVIRLHSCIGFCGHQLLEVYGVVEFVFPCPSGCLFQFLVI